MHLVNIFLLGVAVIFLLILLLKGGWQKGALVAGVVLMAVVSVIPAWQALSGSSTEWIFPGNVVTGPVPLRIDGLSAWFILIINLVFISGVVYGLSHLRSYTASGSVFTLHYLSFLLLHASLLALCAVQNSLVFLVLWEIMTISAFLTVIFEHEKKTTISAGINFLIQSHISLLLLMTGFLYSVIQTGSWDFQAMTSLPSGLAATALMILFIAGFGIKAGFVPFHTWLPYAHPAAPAHISGIMSGVIIKIGIFGILRMLLLLPVNFTTIGYLLLTISLISGVYGVMLAIVQHNLKRLLAYHSIENIGIIGLGMGLGAIGLGSGNHWLVALGFGGALLHTLNHALFKSLLFYTSGNVYQRTHSLNIEHLGGVMKKMPLTALLFLIAAIAICGIPPFNGFVSEFLIYAGLYHWLLDASLVTLVMIIFTVMGLVLIGGLALLCFTKAFGIVFLGTGRRGIDPSGGEVSRRQLSPLWVLALLIVMIGTFPRIFTDMLSVPVAEFTRLTDIHTILPPLRFSPHSTLNASISTIVKPVAAAAWGLILVSLLLWLIRSRVIRKSSQQESPTWSCGYVAPTPKLQYTAGSFARNYTRLFRGVLAFTVREKKTEALFPSGGHFESHPFDKVEKWLVDKPVSAFQWFMSRFLFLQNGKLQVYILYGILFIALVILIPVFAGWFEALVQFLKLM